MLDSATSSRDTPPPARKLAPPPSDAIDPATHLPLVGSYEGPLPPVELGRLGKSLPFRIAHEKAWYYVALASPEVFVGVGILRFGYVASCFAFLFQRGPEAGPSGHFLADHSLLAPPFAAKYAGDDGIQLQFLGDIARFQRAPGAQAFDLEVVLGDFKVQARISGSLEPSPICAIAALGPSLAHATEKRALLNVSGSAEIAGRRFSLDDAFGGFDRSHGYLPRHTVWRWAFAMGRTTTGERIAFNLVDGFVGEAECALWIDNKLHPVGEAKFLFDPDRPLRTWNIKSNCGALDLTFEPGDVHSEHQDLGFVKTRFIQPVGAFSGTVRIGDQTFTLSRVLGVVEDQDALW